MHIFNNLTPDEAEFYDYFIKHVPNYLHDFIDLDKYHIDFTGMQTEQRNFVIGFSENLRYPHEMPEHIITFKVNHNHGHFLVYDIHFELHKLDEITEKSFFFIEPLLKHEEVLI